MNTTFEPNSGKESTGVRDKTSSNLPVSSNNCFRSIKQVLNISRVQKTRNTYATVVSRQQTTQFVRSRHTWKHTTVRKVTEDLRAELNGRY